jgi:hypothetical protein
VITMSIYPWLAMERGQGPSLWSLRSSSSGSIDDHSCVGCTRQAAPELRAERGQRTGDGRDIVERG